MSTEQMAHDLALAFVNYMLNIEIHNTDAEYGEAIFYEKYKEAYVQFYEIITEGA